MATPRSRPRRGRPLIPAIAAAALAAASAHGQTAAPPQARPSPLTSTGVGGCIYAHVSDSVRRQAVREAAAGQGLSEPVTAEIQRLAPQCSSRAFTPGDRVLLAASLAVFLRNGAAERIRDSSELSQREADDAWRAASPDDQTPYLAIAREYLDGHGPLRKPEPAALQPMRAHLKPRGAFSAKAQEDLQSYFAATALGEVAEERMASQAPRTGG